MKTELTSEQFDDYKERGFLLVPEFLDAGELEMYQHAVDEAISNRVGQQTLSQASGGGPTFYENVFVQCSNLWKNHEQIRQLVMDSELGEMVTRLSGVSGQRVYHDHAMVKRPGANPTNWHMDNPFDPFFHRDAISTWLALDDVTVENGCLYYLPGVHREADHSFSEALLSVPDMGALFKVFPQWANIEPVAVEIPAGGLAIHNGLTPHAAGPNMTCGLRRAFSVRYMPDGATCNGKGVGAMDECYLKSIAAGDVIRDAINHPLVFSEHL